MAFISFSEPVFRMLLCTVPAASVAAFLLLIFSVESLIWDRTRIFSENGFLLSFVSLQRNVEYPSSMILGTCQTFAFMSFLN